MPDTITFLGLDFKYTGNSRYLFEELLEDSRFADFTIRFVTADERVPRQYRLDPASPETYKYLARTKLLLAESWIPPRVRKHRDSTWVQLWHGTPIKRMLFDSHEPRIISRRPGHKASKYEDILRWDFLLAESALGLQRFETAFLVSQEKLVLAQYPRVARFSGRASNDHVRSALVRHFDEYLDTEDKLILYAPTWRDVNYAASQAEIDRSHLLDAERLSESLGPGYSVIVHEHSYLPARVGAGVTSHIDASSWEIQELLAATDLLVTDYSSLYFDAIALGKPVVLYTPDLATFREQRGLYEPTWRALSLRWPIARDEDEVASATHRLLCVMQEADGSETPDAAGSPFVDLLVKKILMLGCGA